MNTQENKLFTISYNRYRQPVITVHIVVEEKEMDVEIKPGRPSYDTLVDSIISAIYPNHRMQAVINNYLLDPSNEDTLAEFNQMQELRSQAKAVAKEILSSL